MWVREVRRSWERLKAESPDDVKAAIASVCQDKPSFFKADTIDELEEIAGLFGCTVREDPSTRCYLVLPRSLFRDFDFVLKRDPSLHPFLSERHHELEGLEDKLKSPEFAARSILRGSIHRLTEGKLKKAVMSRYCHDPEVHRRLSPRWLLEIGSG
jgi:hypothetical protein